MANPLRFLFSALSCGFHQIVHRGSGRALTSEQSTWLFFKNVG